MSRLQVPFDPLVLSDLSRRHFVRGLALGGVLTGRVSDRQILMCVRVWGTPFFSIYFPSDFG